MDTNKISEIGENAIKEKLEKYGYNVKNVYYANSHDLEVNGKRVQIKTSNRDLKNGSIAFKLEKNSHGKASHYKLGDYDVLALYAIKLKRAFILNFSENKALIQLRIDPPKNNQRKGIKMADDYELTKLRGDEFFK